MRGLQARFVGGEPARGTGRAPGDKQVGGDGRGETRIRAPASKTVSPTGRESRLDGGRLAVATPIGVALLREASASGLADAVQPVAEQGGLVWGEAVGN
jgi:hypothetical protein